MSLNVQTECRVVLFSEASQASYTNKRLIQMSLNVQTECRAEAIIYSEASQASYTNKRLIQMSLECTNGMQSCIVQ